jgi:hypothetical protein
MYQRLWNILDTTVVQQVESSLQHLVEASVLTPGHPKNGGAKGCPRGSGRRDYFLTDKAIGLRLLELAKYSVGTSRTPTAPPWGR